MPKTTDGNKNVNINSKNDITAIADPFVDRKRYIWIDCVKGVLIILVVLGHMISNKTIGNFVYSFHVPAFFVLSGYLLKCKNNASFSKQQMKKYIIPYLSFSIISIGIRAAYDFCFEKTNLYDNFIAYSIRFLSGFGLPAIWFISSYFIARIVFGVTNQTKKRFQIILNACIVVTIVSLSHFTGLFNSESKNFFLLLFFSLSRGIFCSSFLFLGFRSKEILDLFCKKTGKIGQLGLSVCCFVLCFFLSTINGSTNTSALNFGRYPVFCLICNITGSFGIFCLCRFLFEQKNCKPLEYYGRNSLIVMTTHINFLCIDIAFFLFRKLTDVIFVQWLMLPTIKDAVCLIFVLLLEIPIITIINRFFPFILGKKRSRKHDIEKSKLLETIK